MEKSNSHETLAEFIRASYGPDFVGNIVLFNKRTLKSQFFDSASVTALCEAVEEMQKVDDIYLGISTQADGLPPEKRGSTGTVQQVSMLFADIDFAEDKNSKKKYPPNEKEALKVLKSLPFKPTHVQNSGNGLHVLFVMNSPLICKTASDRKRAAAVSKFMQQLLVDHFKKHGYDIDSVGDLARVFRVPNSYNHKGKNRKRVKTLKFDKDQLLDIDKIASMMAKSKGKKPETATEYPLANHELIAKACPWYSHITGEGASECDEPNWQAGASISRCCDNGEAIFLEYSAKHPDFSIHSMV